MQYIPKAPDTTHIEIPGSIYHDLEAVTEYIHDAWANERMNQGWVFGEHLNSEKKTHPSLVPYSLLPESEKELDRCTALATIKMLLSMGYRIEKG